MFQIDLQDPDGGTAACGEAGQYRPVPTKMPRPLMATGIEQRNDLPRLGIYTGDVRSFVAIARETAQANVARDGRPCMGLCDNVVDLEWEPVSLLRNLTVFATIAGSPPDQFLQRAFHA